MKMEKICPKTIQIEITEDDRILATGAPCMRDACRAFVPECNEVKNNSCQEDITICCKRFEGRNSCYEHCKIMDWYRT